MASVSVIDQLKKAQILELLEQGKRIDGRALDEPREITIEINAIPNEGFEPPEDENNQEGE